MRQVKIFTGSVNHDEEENLLETKMNAWLQERGTTIKVVSCELSPAPACYPCYVVATIMYEPIP